MSFWQSDKTSLISRTSHVLKTELFSDVKFSVGPGGTEFSAHKLILCLASPVFEQRFHQQVQNVLTTDLSVMRVPDIMPQAFYKMLKYIYTDYVEFNSIEDADDVLAAADKFKLSHLQWLCQQYIKERELPIHKVCKMYEIASDLEMMEVQKMCLFMFTKHTEAVLKSNSFLDIKRSTLKAIITHKSPLCNEMTILNAVMKWSLEECTRRRLPHTNHNIRMSIEPVLKYIEFLSLSIDEFQAFLNEYEILTPNEVFKITKKLSQPMAIASYSSSLCSDSILRSQSVSPISFMSSSGNNEMPPKLPQFISTCSEPVSRSQSALSCPFIVSSSNYEEDNEISKKLLRPVVTTSSATEQGLRTQSISQYSGIASYSQKDLSKSNAELKKTYNGTAKNFVQSSETLSLVNSDSPSNHSSSHSDYTDCDSDSSDSGPITTVSKECKSCSISLRSDIDIPNRIMIVNISSIVHIEMKIGNIKIIGFIIQLKKDYSTKFEKLSFISRISKGLGTVEDTRNVVFDTDQSEFFLKKPVMLFAGESVKIELSVDDVQLIRCSVCDELKFVVRDKGMEFHVTLSSNQKSFQNTIPFFIKNVLYDIC